MAYAQELRKLADELWERGFKEVSGKVHEMARREEIKDFWKDDKSKG